MPHHTVLFSSSIATATESQVNAVSDGIITIQNNNFLPQRPYVASYAAGCATNMQRLRLRTPSIRQIADHWVRGINRANTWGFPQRVDHGGRNALAFKAGEEITALATQNAAGAQTQYVALALSETPPAPVPGTAYSYRGTSSGTATAGAWTLVPMTWTDALPDGEYAVVGGTFFSATNLVGRLVFENQTLRPGALGVQALENDVDPIFRYGGLGVWGSFRNYAPPQVEVFCTAADTAHEVYLDIVPTGRR